MVGYESREGGEVEGEVESWEGEEEDGLERETEVWIAKVWAPRVWVNVVRRVRVEES